MKAVGFFLVYTPSWDVYKPYNKCKVFGPESASQDKHAQGQLHPPGCQEAELSACSALSTPALHMYDQCTVIFALQPLPQRQTSTGVYWSRAYKLSPLHSYCYCYCYYLRFTFNIYNNWLLCYYIFLLCIVLHFRSMSECSFKYPYVSHGLIIDSKLPLTLKTAHSEVRRVVSSHQACQLHKRET